MILLEIEDINEYRPASHILFEWRGQKRLSSEFIISLRALECGSKKEMY